MVDYMDGIHDLATHDEPLFWDIVDTTPSILEAYDLLERGRTAIAREAETLGGNEKQKAQNTLAAINARLKKMREQQELKRLQECVFDLFGHDAWMQLREYMIDTDPFLHESEREWHKRNLAAKERKHRDH